MRNQEFTGFGTKNIQSQGVPFVVPGGRFNEMYG
jgi:neutral trehalase